MFTARKHKFKGCKHMFKVREHKFTVRKHKKYHVLPTFFSRLSHTFHMPYSCPKGMRNYIETIEKG